MLLNGGELDGVRVLKSETIDLMWKNYLTNDLLSMRMVGWESNAQTGFGLSFTIASPTPSIFDVSSSSRRRLSSSISRYRGDYGGIVWWWQEYTE